NPYDDHTLQTVIPDMEKLVGNIIQQLLLDKGYHGHNAPPDYKFRVFKFRVFISGQKRDVTPLIKRTMRGRSAIEPVISHLKAEHRIERNYLWFKQGDTNNAVLAAVGYNFRRLLRWLRHLLHRNPGRTLRQAAAQSNLKQESSRSTASFAPTAAQRPLAMSSATFRHR
ncbi:hypothetical protein IVB56_16565, partial [Bradyrhizobium sp. CW7]|nr:hypothetical protein [Bradyrhizobium sp. CW7]